MHSNVDLKVLYFGTPVVLIQLECTVTAAHALGDADLDASAIDVQVVRAHVDDDLRLAGTNYMYVRTHRLDDVSE